MRTAELEALQEEFFLLKEDRIRLIGEQLQAIQTEIGRRDLSKVHTDKLLGLQLRYFGELKGEYVETGQRAKTGPKLNRSDISEELQSVLIRYRAGEIGEAQAKLEQAVLQSALKAIEQTELAAKLERLEAVIRSRRWADDKDVGEHSGQTSSHQGIERLAGSQAPPTGFDRQLPPPGLGPHRG